MKFALAIVSILFFISSCDRDSFKGDETNKKVSGGSPPIAQSGTNIGTKKISDANCEEEECDKKIENDFADTSEYPLSTFSIDVDTASYANARRYINEGTLPPSDAVRIEEFLNYFKYDYSPPKNEDPFSVNYEVNTAPWDKDHRLLKIGLKGKEIATEKRPKASLTFLIDSSGSMGDEDKLPLLKTAFSVLVDHLSPDDVVSIVTYAESARKVLPPTPGSKKQEILNAINDLEAGGSTAGAAGIDLAYEVADEAFIKDGTNRVILATDGDFNVGVSDDDELVKIIETKAKSGVFLSILGLGMAGYKDTKMEKLADTGNGNYAYIDSVAEAKKVLMADLSGTIFTIAKDVKIQIEFNPKKIKKYRLIGYEDRLLAVEDFNNDKKDAGEIGAGHSVTALYELIVQDSTDVMGGAKVEVGKVDPLVYQDEKGFLPAADQAHFISVKLRYKTPQGDESKLIASNYTDDQKTVEAASVDFKFAAAVAEFGMVLRGSQFKGESSFETISRIATDGKGPDLDGYRGEFISLVEKAKKISGK